MGWRFCLPAPGMLLSKPSEEYPRFCKWRDEFAPDSLAVPKYKIRTNIS